MPAILKIQIGYDIEVKDILTKIENEKFEILELESLKFDYNVKTCRIVQELIKKGFNPVNVRYVNRKEKYEKTLLQFMLTNPKSCYNENKELKQNNFF